MSGNRDYVPVRNRPLILAELKRQDGQTLLELFTALGVGRDGLMNAIDFLVSIDQVRKEQTGEGKTHYRVWLKL